MNFDLDKWRIILLLIMLLSFIAYAKGNTSTDISLKGLNANSIICTKNNSGGLDVPGESLGTGVHYEKFPNLSQMSTVRIVKH